MVQAIIRTLALLASINLIQTAIATRLLILADIHLDLESTTQYVRPGDETSPDMLTNVLNEAAKREAGNKIDAILVIGDLCKHGLASFN